MSLPATCVADAALYAKLTSHGGLLAPLMVGDAEIRPADMPHGTFGRLVRDKVDPLWGGYSLAPEEWEDLRGLINERDPDGVEPSLLEFAPVGLLARDARRILDQGKRPGSVQPNMALLLLDLHCRIEAGLLGKDDPDEETAAMAPAPPAVPPPELSAPGVTPIRPPVAALLPPEPATPNGSNANGLVREIAPQPAAPKDTLMQFTADKGSLLAALRKAAGLVPKKTTMPILSHILLDVGNDLTISGTDLAVDVQVTMPIGMGATPGKVAAPGADLVSAIGTLPDGAQVTLERTEDGRLRILSGRARFHLPIRQPDEMPAFAPADGHEIRAQAQEWRKALDRVAFAVAKDEVVKAQLCGVFLHARREGLRVVGFNGNLLSRSDLSVTVPPRDFVASYDEPGLSPGVLIPRDSVGILRSLLGDVDDTQEVVATVSPRRAVFDLSSVRFGTTLSAAQFPPYEGLIEHNHQPDGRKLAVPRADFLACVERVKTLAGDKYKAVALTITAEGVRAATTGESGTDAVDILEIPTRYGEGTLRIGFLAEMLIAALKSLGEPALLCDLDGALGATFWRAIQEEDIGAAEHLVIVLPCRISTSAEG